MMTAPIFPPKTENIATAKTFHATPVVDPGKAWVQHCTQICRGVILNLVNNTLKPENPRKSYSNTWENEIKQTTMEKQVGWNLDVTNGQETGKICSL